MSLKGPLEITGKKTRHNLCQRGGPKNKKKKNRGRSYKGSKPKHRDWNRRGFLKGSNIFRRRENKEKKGLMEGRCKTK